MRWLVRALIVLEFVIVGLLFVCLNDVIDFVYLAFLALMACVGLILVLLLEILERIAVQKKKRRG